MRGCRRDVIMENTRWHVSINYQRGQYHPVPVLTVNCVRKGYRFFTQKLPFRTKKIVSVCVKYTQGKCR